MKKMKWVTYRIYIMNCEVLRIRTFKREVLS